MTYRHIIASAVLASGMLVLAQGGAQAGIVCDGNFQIVNGYPVGTPYCRDANLARVARAYGWHVSDSTVRYDENTKAQVCRTIGFDNRVRDVCAAYRSDGAGSFRF